MPSRAHSWHNDRQQGSVGPVWGAEAAHVEHPTEGTGNSHASSAARLAKLILHGSQPEERQWH